MSTIEEFFGCSLLLLVCRTQTDKEKHPIHSRSATVSIILSPLSLCHSRKSEEEEEEEERKRDKMVSDSHHVSVLFSMRTRADE